MEDLTPRALATLGAAMWWNPLVHAATAETLGAILLGRVDNAGTRMWARSQLRRTGLMTVLSAIQSVCQFASDDWIGQVDVPTAVVITTRNQIVPAGRQRRLARTIPGAVVHELQVDHGVCVKAPKLFAPVLFQACRSVTAPSRAERHREGWGLAAPGFRAEPSGLPNA